MQSQITRDKLVIWFIKNEPKLYKDMLDSNHAVDIYQPNIFHCEGSVWTHSLMVMTWIEACKNIYTIEDYTVLITSALLHDTGKPSCSQEMPASENKPIRNSFKGHEGVSSFIQIGILKKLQSDFPDIYTYKIIEKIIKVVSLHGCYIEEGSENEFLRKELHTADKRGAVRIVDEELFSQYEKRKFLKTTSTNKEKNLTLLVGLPCSGKSTIREQMTGYVISRDDYMEEFHIQHFGERGDYNKMYFNIHSDEKILNLFNNSFQKLIENAARTQNDVIVDMTMLSLSSRRKMMNNFQNFTKKAVVLMTDLEEIQKRNLQRKEHGKYISESVFKGMMTSFVFPVAEEGFSEIELVIN